MPESIHIYFLVLLLLGLGCGGCEPVRVHVFLRKAPMPQGASALQRKGRYQRATALYQAFSATALQPNKMPSFCFSPHMLSQLLYTAFEGARGNTAFEMAQALHISLPSHARHKLLQQEQTQWRHRTQQITKRSVLLAPTALQPAFAKMARTVYQVRAGLASVSSAGKSAQMGTKHSSQKPAPSPMVLKNETGFRAPWTFAFSRELTQQADFWVTPSQPLSVKMMQIIAPLGWAKQKTMDVVELPLQGGWGLVLFQPKKGRSLAWLEQVLTHPANLRYLLKAIKWQVLSLSLPRFQVDASQLQPKAALKALGMEHAFSRHAHFSGMFAPNKQARLFVKQVDAKASLHITESGIHHRHSKAPPPRSSTWTPSSHQIKSVEIKRPFFFVLRHRRTHTILMMGRWLRP